MSYSFSITAANKDEASKKVSDELAKVCVSQPIHAIDCDQAHAAAVAFIGFLPDPTDSEQISVFVSGSLGWRGDMEEKNFTSANVSVGASLLSKTAV